jgi:hypothetical protein
LAPLLVTVVLHEINGHLLDRIEDLDGRRVHLKGSNGKNGPIKPWSNGH